MNSSRPAVGVAFAVILFALATGGKPTQAPHSPTALFTTFQAMAHAREGRQETGGIQLPRRHARENRCDHAAAWPDPLRRPQRLRPGEQPSVANLLAPMFASRLDSRLF